ncbi:unnamed protein product [Closterium sp. NIES-65]|nr:unnamed protein product [Closterium sp. NIES-65]
MRERRRGFGPLGGIGSSSAVVFDCRRIRSTLTSAELIRSTLTSAERIRSTLTSAERIRSTLTSAEQIRSTLTSAERIRSTLTTPEWQAKVRVRAGQERGSVTEMPTDASGQRRGIPAKAWHPCQGVASLPRRGIPAKAWRRGALPVTIRLLTRLGICLTVAAGRGDQRGQATDLQAAAAARRERSKTTSIAHLLFACVYAVFTAVVPVPPALRPKDTAAFLPQGGAAVRVSIRTTWLTTWLAISSTQQSCQGVVLLTSALRGPRTQLRWLLWCRCEPPAPRPKDTATGMPRGGASRSGAVQGRIRTTWLAMAVWYVAGLRY